MTDPSQMVQIPPLTEPEARMLRLILGSAEMLLAEYNEDAFNTLWEKVFASTRPRVASVLLGSPTPP